MGLRRANLNGDENGGCQTATISTLDSSPALPHPREEPERASNYVNGATILEAPAQGEVPAAGERVALQMVL